MQQQKNLLLFIMVALVVLMGWSALQEYYWPRPKKKKPATEVEQAQESAKYQETLEQSKFHLALPAMTQAWMEQLPGSPGLANACQLVGQLALADWSGRISRAWVVRPPPVVSKPPPDITTFTLGDEKTFNLHVVVTSLGAGVEAITLNNFEQADKLGLPAGHSLELVPSDPDAPSFRIYHYPDAKGNQPLETLGKLNWKPVGKLVIDNAGEKNETHRVAFEAVIEEQQVKITKTYSLSRGDYHIGLDVQLERLGDNERPEPFRYQMAGGHGLPVEGEWYTYIFRNSLIGVVDSRGNVDRDLQDSRTIGIQDGGNPVFGSEKKHVGYAGVVTQYFASMIVVDNKQPGDADPAILAWARPTVEDSDVQILLYEKERRQAMIDMTTRVVSQPIDVRPGKPVTHRYLLYHGPVKVRLLGQLDGAKQVAADLVERYETALHLDTLTDYQSPGMFGSFFSAIGWTRVLILCTNMMHGLLHLLHSVVANYGICIILLTVIVRGALFPLSRKQAAASAKMQEKMRELAPEVKKLEEKYRNDPMALQQAKNELYLKRGINPLAMMGSCWIIFLQMPIFLGLYYALQESIHFRLAKFLWMPNLAAPDMLYEWGMKVPLVSTWLGPFLNVLPIIAVSLMLVQQKMMMPPPTNEQEAMQQSMTKWMMVVMGFLFYKLPSGLCIYFIASSAWGLSERKLLPKKPDATTTPPSEPPPARGKGSLPKGKSKDNANGHGAFQRVKDWWADVLEQASKNPRKIERGKK